MWLFPRTISFLVRNGNLYRPVPQLVPIFFVNLSHIKPTDKSCTFNMLPYRYFEVLLGKLIIFRKGLNTRTATTKVLQKNEIVLLIVPLKFAQTHRHNVAQVCRSYLFDLTFMFLHEIICCTRWNSSDDTNPGSLMQNCLSQIDSLELICALHFYPFVTGTNQETLAQLRKNDRKNSHRNHMGGTWLYCMTFGQHLVNGDAVTKHSAMFCLRFRSRACR